MKLVKITVADEFVSGAGVSIGAVGTHGEVVIEARFSALWEEKTKIVIWHNAIGEPADTTPLTPFMLVEGQKNTYRFKVPYEATKYAGEPYIVIKGTVIDTETNIELSAITTEKTYFCVPDSVEGISEGDDVSASNAERLTAQIEAIINKLKGFDGSGGGTDVVGITNATINNNGELELTFSTGNIVNLGKVVGSDGKDGIDGKDGVSVDTLLQLNGIDESGITTFSPLTNHKYSAEISTDCAFVLPSEIDPTIDNAILVYANFKEAVSVIWGDVQFYGGVVPEITEGPCDIIFAYNPTVKKWCVGITGDYGASSGTGAAAVGISDTEINDKGELVITYTDSTSKNLGSVKGADGKDGCTPVKGVDYWTDSDKTEMNADNISFISTELAKRGQLKPEFAQNIEGCTDTSKLYVLPDGYIYAFMIKTVNPTNQLTKAVDTDGTPFNGGKGWKTGYFLNPSGGDESESTGYEVTGYIPYAYTKTFRAKNLTLEEEHGYNSIAFYDKDFNFIKIFTMNSSYNPMSQFVQSDGTVQGRIADNLTSNITEQQKQTIAYFRIGCISIDDATVITVDEPLESTNNIDWYNTDLAFVPADYEDRIIELEEKVNATPTNTSVVSLNSNTCSIFKKVVCCGDSFTAGYINIGNGVQETNEDYSWVSFMGRLTGNEYINCGASGATVLTWQTSSRGLSKAKSAGVAQAYLVGLGINDTSNVTLGTSADIGTDNQTYYGGMSKIVRELNTISPKAKIFLQTMPTNSETRQAYNEAVREIVEAYKDTYPVYLLDLDAYKSLYFVPTITGDSIGGHYTAIAYQQFAENLRYIWSEYINSHIGDFQDVYSLPCS